MIEIPDPESIELAADWIELILATQERQLSKAAFSAAIEGNSGTEASEIFISSVWRELDYRRSLYSSSYYAVGERTVESRLKTHAPSEYLLCLLLSLFGVQGNAQLPGKIFERLTREAIKHYLGGKAQVFGWPFDKMEGDEETLIKQKVRKLADELSEKFYETPAPRFKDRGLDVVGWIPHIDKRSGQIVILLQCAAGHNWVDKLPVPLEAWCQYIHWASNPIKAFAVPCVVGERVWHEISKDKGVLFDRIRIMNLLADGIEDKELNDALYEWVQDQLKTLAE
jgi:hypothetical protein